MVNPECLDPKEVLGHLQALGYGDINPQQLKDFMHDLKKLIKYEQKHLNCNKSKSLSSQASDSECSCAEYENSSGKSTSSENYDNSSISSCSTSPEYIQQKSTECEENIPQKTRLQLDYELSQKIQTSFIRPWNLHAGKEASNKSKKHVDPVRLYHQYKELWSRQNIPGENKHSQLCWFIRSRMMGQEPSPRICTGSNRGFMS